MKCGRSIPPSRRKSRICGAQLAMKFAPTVAILQNAEPKAPKALLDEMRSLNSSIQAQEPNVRRVVAEELRSAVANLQNTEPKVSKAILDEIRTIAANVKTQEARPQTPQASVVDQIKVLQASVEALKAKLSEERGRTDDRGKRRYRSASPACGDRIGPVRQVPDAACFAWWARLGSRCAAGRRCAAITVSQEKRSEPAAVVFYDNVMLKKDQEKQYDEIGVRLALQTVGSRQVRVAVNKQGFRLVVRRTQGVPQPGCRVRDQFDGDQSQRVAGSHQHFLQALRLSSMPLIFFVRHGQTDYNASKRIQGTLEIPINGTGREQARRNGGLLDELIGDKARFDFVASPLLRARQTMEIVRRAMGLSPDGYRTDDRLKEIASALGAGLTWRKLRRAIPRNYARRQADRWNEAPPEGQCYRDVYRAVVGWLEEANIGYHRCGAWRDGPLPFAATFSSFRPTRSCILTRRRIRCS